jgi:hypothetical protein
MKRSIVYVMCAVLMTSMLVAEDFEEQPIVEEVKEEKPAKKEKKPKAPKAPKEKKAKAPKAKKPKAPKAEKEEEAKKVEKPAPEDLTITGIISKEGGVKVDDKKVPLQFFLTDADGKKLQLPKPPKVKKDDPEAKAVKWADYVGKTVTIVAKGRIVTKKGNESLSLAKVISIEAQGGVEEIDLFGDKDAKDASDE